VLAEALAYVGIVAMVVAAALADVAFPAGLGPNVGLAAAVTAAFWGAALAVPARLGRQSVRIRSALLFASLGPFAELVAFSTGVGAGWTVRAAALTTAGATLAVAAVLWRLHRRLPQQAGVLLYTAATAGIATTFLDYESLSLIGSAVCAVGGIWFALAWGGLIAPRRGGTVLGAITALLGAGTVLVLGTSVLGLAVVAAMLLLALAFRDLVLLGLASVSSLIVLPVALDRYFSNLTVPVVVLATAGAVVVAAVMVAGWRWDRPAGPPDAHDWSAGSSRVAVLVSALIAAGAAAAIITLGLQ
jgi:hypothetical protein